MLLPSQLIERFSDFLREFYGIQLKVHDEPWRDEVARFMLGERLAVIRMPSQESRGEDTPLVYDLVCGDKDKLVELEKVWSRSIMEEINADKSADGGEVRSD